MDHRRLSPTCRFICNLPCDDVSTDFSFNILSLTKEGTSASGSFNMARGWIKLEANKAKYPCYSAYQLRLDSLKNWPASKTQTKEQLAEAGFFYPNMPVHDLVLCFYCDLGISDWKDNEDPWEMHALRMPNCFYLLQVKNQDLENHHSLRISTVSIFLFACCTHLRSFISKIIIIILRRRSHRRILKQRHRQSKKILHQILKPAT